MGTEPGWTAIEASAGTGKTHILADLATRYVAECDIRAGQLLIVTFTRAATSELRHRIRGRLVRARSALESTGEDSGAVPELDWQADPLLVHLVSADRGRRLERIQRAVREFDACTITTIHGFAGQVLGSLGSGSGVDPSAPLRDDEEDLCASVCADVLSLAALSADPLHLPKYLTLRNAVSRASAMPDVGLAPPDDPSASDRERMMTALVDRARAEMGERRQAEGTRSFNGLLMSLREALEGPGGDATAEALRHRYAVALIDEFQDTDEIQWQIFRRIFGAPGSSRLALVGDPKQAIYSFRGADVHTYLHAIEGPPAMDPVRLDINWRSDGHLLRALNALFDGASFAGDGNIPFAPTRPAPGHEGSHLRGPDGEPITPLRIRMAIGPDLKRQNGRDIQVDDARHAVYRDMAAQIRDVLGSAEIPDRDGGRDGSTLRALRPRDIAVLVRTGAEAAGVQGELAAQGIPAVLARGQSVLDSPAADQWRWLLWALQRPSDPRRARTFGLTWFSRTTTGELAVMSEADLAGLQLTMETWVETLTRRGVSAFVRRVMTESQVVPRVLAFPDGDRVTTDLEHVGELLQSASSLVRTGLAGLLSVIDTEPTDDADAEVDVDDTTARRIESEEDAVQIMTVWVAKGLEFPVVCCPTLWCNPMAPDWVYEDPDTGERTFQVTRSTTWPDKEGAKIRAALAAREALGERFRLLYVALTRARHQTLLWWSQSRGSGKTSVARLLFARDETGALDSETYWADAAVTPPGADTVEAFLGNLVARTDGAITVAVHGDTPRPGLKWTDPEALEKPPINDLRVASFNRVLDRSRHRWSFTSLTSAQEAATFDPWDPAEADSGADDEGDSAAEPAAEEDTAGGQFVPLAPPALALLPAGPRFGTLVHSVLEAADFSAGELSTELAAAIAAQQRWMNLDLTPTAQPGISSEPGEDLLAAGLVDALATPLGTALGGIRLADLAPAQRINEMSFDLRLGAAGTPATMRAVGALLSTRLFVNDPFVGWAATLPGRFLDRGLAGHLTGSVDLIFRTDSGRFVVADYKTNRLGPPGTEWQPGEYGQTALAKAMADHDYPLQALLYSVALHRYLRWRLSDYDAATHLGGAAYLFVRGMTGPGASGDEDRPDGVFHWAIPPILVEQLSDLLDGSSTEGSS